MNKIREIFAKPIDRTIEEVIKVQQADEKAVLTELDEYVPTDFLQEQYERVFKEIASGPSNPREGIGIWISGFFGSGKSLFAKILGYTVAVRKVGAKTATELFKAKLTNSRVSAWLDSINTRVPFHAVIFDVSIAFARLKGSQKKKNLCITSALSKRSNPSTRPEIANATPHCSFSQLNARTNSSTPLA
jgi:hypothetical protein